ncbi:MAG: hypothetical protein ACOVJ6_09790 [Pirellulales bacterium]
MTDPDEVIRAAEEVTGILESRGVGALVIGAVALAAHGYVRFTEDLDLGVNTDLGTLNQVADALQTAGFEVELREQKVTATKSGQDVNFTNFGGCHLLVEHQGAGFASGHWKSARTSSIVLSKLSTLISP